MAHSKKLLAHRPAFQSVLLAWYQAHHRRLPWREQPSVYKTVVSEFMLQQTQVKTVLPYFARWLIALPDFAALAAAPESQVLKLWEGLGYYSRARNLRQLAQHLTGLPTLPRTPLAWRELPGIGPYTAAAITSISFGEPAAVVDGNVVRILARLTGEKRLFRDGTAAVKFFTPLAAALISGAEPGPHNQAMMELGATVCVRQNPQCLLCPVAKFCAAKRGDTPGQFPRFAPKKMERRTVTRVWCEHHGQLLLRRGHARAKQLAGLYELPETIDLALATPGKQDLLAVKRRAITRFQITESIYRIGVTPPLRRKIAANAALEWIALTDLRHLTLSGPHRRWVEELRPHAPGQNQSKEA